MRSNLFDGEAALPGPSMGESLAMLPARRGLALLAAEGDQPVLLLPAADLRARVTGRLRDPDAEERRRLPDLQAITRKVYWRLAHSHFETDLRFLEISRELWPDTYAELLAWRPAWFIRVDLAADYPYFSRTQEVLAGAGRHFGPFLGGGSAQRFIGALADAFELCRDLPCLRQSPHGRRCSYGQMGKCLCPCDGTISSGDYRRAVAEAADFVAGRRSPVIERFQEAMKQAAAGLRFERASAIKGRLERLAALAGADYAHVAPAEEFRFLLIQRGPSRKRLLAFFADNASILSLGPIDFSPNAGQLRKVLDSLPGRRPSPDSRSHSADPAASPDPWSMGLVAHYLFASPRRRGLILPLREGPTAEGVCQGVQGSAEALGLRRADAETPPSS